MARNSEKAMTALARWRKAKEAEEGLDTKSERRPYLGKYFVILNRESKFRGWLVRILQLVTFLFILFFNLSKMKFPLN